MATALVSIRGFVDNDEHSFVDEAANRTCCIFAIFDGTMCFTFEQAKDKVVVTEEVLQDRRNRLAYNNAVSNHSQKKAPTATSSNTEMVDNL